MILETLVDRPQIIMMYFNKGFNSMLDIHLIGGSAYSFDCTFFKLICLTANALRRTTMRGPLVGATEPEKRTLKRVQLRFLG